MDPEDLPPAWKWTEELAFVQDCHALDPDPDEVDFIRKVIGESLLDDPFAASNPLLDEVDTTIRYFRTLEAPGLSHLPPKIVIFRVEDEPADEQAPRELTGLALWDDDDS